MATAVHVLRLLDLVQEPETPSACWTWTGGGTRNGYGLFDGIPESKTRLVHRLVYEILVGPIPDGKQLDHLCSNRRCVNPAHLEPVSGKENVHRSSRHTANRTHCPQGHPYNMANTHFSKEGWRSCRACKRERN